jgi:hypothetical protein
VWNVLMTLVNGPEDEARLEAHLHTVFGLFSAYFIELARHGQLAPAHSQATTAAGLSQIATEALRASATAPAAS